MKRYLANWTLFLLLAAGVAGWFVWDLYREGGTPVVEAVPLRERSLVADEAVVWEAPRVLPEMAEPEAEVAVAVEWPEGAVEGELLLMFGSDEELREFLRQARREGWGIDVEPVLRTVRLRGLDSAGVRRLREIAGDAVPAFNPYVLSPDVPPMEEMGEGYEGFGEGVLDWLGIPKENADWGKGVKVAVLDTGLAEHPALAHLKVSELSLLTVDARRNGVGTHGTAVASLLAGDGAGIRGVAPGAEILSVQVLDANGVGSGFDLARGIVAAVDAGANPIVLSLGTPIHSDVLQAAVNYAMERGVIAVAAAGNEGAGQLLFPAGYPGVISVGAVDARGKYLPFSNRGTGLSISAPGFQMNAAAGADGTFLFSGTSGAAPLVGGMVAGLLSEEPHLTAAEVKEVLVRYSDDAGPPGQDGYYGEGRMNPRRILRRKEPDILDVAIADHFLGGGAIPEVTVTVQNLGTVPAGNVFLEISIDDRKQTTQLGQIAVNGIASKTVSLAPFFRADTEGVIVYSRVFIPGMKDDEPLNDWNRTRVERRRN